MLIPEIQLAQSNHPHWFCVRTERKREAIAAACVVQLGGVDSFCPLIRFQKLTRRGAVWFQEALFPGYVFARFIFMEKHRYLLSLPGIHSLVRFGHQYGVIDDLTIAHLRAATGDQKVITIDTVPQPGDLVNLTDGPFKGVEVMVTRYLPENDRVRTLLNLLGREVEIEIAKSRTVPRCVPRSAIAMRQER